MKLKRLLSLVLIAGFFLLLPTNQALANEKQPGLQVTVSTDKQNYTVDEPVQSQIQIINTLPITGDNLVVTTTLPESLQGKSGDVVTKDQKLVWEFEKVGESETITLDLQLQHVDSKVDNLAEDGATDSITDTDDGAPNTGDDTDFLTYVIILGISSLVLIVSITVMYKKKASKNITFLLIPAMLLAPFADAKAETSKVSVSTSHEIQFEDQKYEIVTTAEIDFDYSQLELTNDFALKVKAQEASFELVWNEIKNAKAYKVLRKFEKKDFTEIVNEHTSTNYIDNNIKEYGVYTYKIIALGHDGRTKDSNEVSVYNSEFGIGVIPDNIDTDQDGLPDALEEVLKSDPTNADTDEDGLPDGYEYQYLGSNLLKKDTDGNGTTDDQEDFDADGLSNLKEYELKTNPLNADSDFDGLKDSDEVNTYSTEPINEDTDGDGLTDGNEISQGTNPLVQDTDGDGTKDGDETFELTVKVDENNKDNKVQPSVTMNLSGKNLDSVSISKISANNPYLNEAIPGYIGSAYEFNTPASFDTAQMTFSFDKKLLSNSNFNPAIYYFNEDTKGLELLPNQKINKERGEVSTTVSHFSSYILLNKTELDKVWAQEMKPPHSGEIVDVELVIGFSIDSSGSMDLNDPKGIRKQTAKKFVDKLDDNDKAAVIDFDMYADVLTPLTSDKDTIKEAIDRIDSWGGTNLTAGMRAAIDALKDNESDVKYVILLTDGQGYYNHNLTKEAIDRGIVVFTIGLGNDIDEGLLQKIATETGGKYYHASTTDDLDGIFDNTSEETVDLATDTDGDGLSDYHEKRGMRTSNGLWITTDFEKKDSDGDSIQDGDEMVYKNESFLMKSNPTLKDSDTDGILDKKDPKPMVYSITDRTLSLVAGLSYSNLNANISSTIDSLVKSNYNFSSIGSSGIEELKDWTIIHANDSGGKGQVDSKDFGLGSVAIKITRPGQPDAIIFGLRGTEPSSDPIHDFLTDGVLFFGIDSIQSKYAFTTYSYLAKYYPNAEFYVTGHSLGGRLAQDVFYKVHDKNDGAFGFFKDDINEPAGATFNALGYNRGHYSTLKGSIVSEAKKQITNYYYKKDLVGELFGNSDYVKRIGKEVGGWTPRDKHQNIINPELNFFSSYAVSEIHGINLFHSDSNLRYDNINILN
ncbi:VWA domain-containing protein [Priestia taiwanensis]|uniref:VWFA domain-containing protein n=1 Tax=Priestia taiwanensis TaxID=1347902 RepID=A0A917AWN6_9BACI|nr:VWA domain-containing protein [Priestia taiwanensis]MBM7364772.1 hypothetical protein [Priestia taiwanensis]GGE79492.1 hypothetical protein GCM10007140_31360 [Priestia taiwanensis]